MAACILINAISRARKLSLRETISCPQQERGTARLQKRPASLWLDRGRGLQLPASCRSGYTHPPFRVLPMSGRSQPQPFPRPGHQHLRLPRGPPTTLPHLQPDTGRGPTRAHLNVMASQTCSGVTLPFLAFEALPPRHNPVPGSVGPSGWPPPPAGTNHIPEIPFSHFQNPPPGGVPPPGDANSQASRGFLRGVGTECV